MKNRSNTKFTEWQTHIVVLYKAKDVARTWWLIGWSKWVMMADWIEQLGLGSQLVRASGLWWLIG